MDEKAAKIKRSCLKKNAKKSASHKQDSCEGKSLWLLVARSTSQEALEIEREALSLWEQNKFGPSGENTHEAKGFGHAS